MLSSNIKLLLLTILSVAWYPYLVVANKVTVNAVNLNVPGNDVIDSWNHDLANNLIATNINVKKNCPGVVQAEIKIYKGDSVVNQMVQTLDKPIEDLKSYGICESIDSPDLDDDSCSVAQGEQAFKDCDVSEWFSNMDPGDYKAECNLKIDENVISSGSLEVTVESG